MPSDTDRICRIVGCTQKEWDRIRPNIAPFLRDLGSGKITLKDLEQIRISNISTARQALPMSTKKLVAERDTHRCVYCGDIEGPFHFDHLFPRSRGGSDKPDNIVIACAPCNLAKGDKTLLEWMAIR
ncbi:HNH endonuclease [Agrobacterium rhizogenes]|nr:HNH endonuclease [Rhizobium rhizogenes]